LEHAVESGKFRGDLLMALSVGQVDIPALRERPEDILLLAERYLAFLSREHHKPIVGFTRDATFVLKTHLWPGNTRELRNVVERAVLTCESEFIGLEHLPVDIMNATAKTKEAVLAAYQVGDLVPLSVIEEAHIRQVLASAKTIRRAAAVLGLNASALCRRLKRAKMEAQHDKLAQ
jgi:two-component system, NtrC family, response regulator AlgB